MQCWPSGTIAIDAGHSVAGPLLQSRPPGLGAVTCQRPPLHDATVSQASTVAVPYSQTRPCGPHIVPSPGAAARHPVPLASTIASVAASAAGPAVPPPVDELQLATAMTSATALFTNPS